MRRFNKTGFLLFCITLSAIASKAQSCFWLETWSGTACAKGCTTYTGPNGAWTVNSGVGPNGTAANRWFFSTQEKGQGRTVCGAAGAPATAHISNVSTSPLAAFFCPGGDCGAAYDAGLGNGKVLSNKRLESPVINCTGQSTITLSFNYIMSGQTAKDFCTVYYFDGTSWSLLASPAKTTTCSGQGKWTYYSVALPVSANNNPSVQIGFYWQNNDDGAGNDPSFAVDSVCLSVPIVFPIRLSNFSAKYDSYNDGVDINWSTATETNNSLFTIERTADGETYSQIATVKGAGNSLEVKNYSTFDTSPYDGTNYYRLKQTDFDGHFTYSNMVSVDVVITNKIKVFPNPAGSYLSVSYYSQLEGVSGTIKIYDNTGREITAFSTISKDIGENTDKFDISRLAPGMYLIKLETLNRRPIFDKFIKQ